MSENVQENRIPSNDEVINELTKDLESQCISKECDEERIPKDIIGDPNDALDAQFNTENKSIPTEKQDYVPEDFDKSESDSESNRNPPIEDDYVDEEALKDRDLTLTEEEAEDKHKEALELKNKGNDEFKNGEYLESIATYTDALRLCPLKYDSDRSIFYANRAASKTKIDRKKSAIDDCTRSIELNPNYIKALIRRAKLYEETEKLDESLEDNKKILELDPGNQEARFATIRLPPLINERNEKLKTEMFGKLKDLGNMFLRPFGLSTDNFAMQQDPNSGGYSINFKK